MYFTFQKIISPLNQGVCSVDAPCKNHHVFFSKMAAVKIKINKSEVHEKNHRAYSQKKKRSSKLVELFGFGTQGGEQKKKVHTFLYNNFLYKKCKMQSSALGARLVTYA